MPSRNLRSDIIPTSIIVWYNQTGALPSGFIHECLLYGKYLKGVPNACTNPNACAGSNTHCDPSASIGNHNHPTATSCNHQHGTSWGSSAPTACYATHTSPSTTSPLSGTHTHSHNSTTCATISITSCNTNPASHNHNTAPVNNEPLNILIRNIKRTTAPLTFRRNDVPRNIIVMNAKPLACKPKSWCITLATGRIFKGVANACDAPGVTGGSACHVHTLSAGAHTHGVSGTAHTHSSSGTSGPAAGPFTPYSGGGPTTANQLHTHTGNICLTGGAATGVTASSGNHTHPAACHLPASVELAYYAKSSISFRRRGIPQYSIAAWLGTIASIPSNYKLTDGTQDTPNLLNKFTKGIPNACTNPGTNVGNTTHNHPAATHTHTGNLCHSHTASGTSSVGSSDTTSGSINIQPFPVAGHTHAAASPSGSSNTPYNLPAGGSHQHGNACNNPAHKTVAWIMRL